MIAFVLLLSLCSAIDFKSWAAKHKKNYSAAEALRRRTVFSFNQKYVDQFNARRRRFRLTVEGPFADMTNGEYQQLLKHTKVEPVDVPVMKATKKGIPAAVDWRAEGKVPAIRDQAQCGSCYAFGSLAAFESRLLIAGSTKFTAETIDFSEQQIVDCSDRSNGCNGGNILYTFAYTKSDGVMLEKDYPYTATDGTCAYDASKVVAKNGGERIVAQTDEAALTEAIAEGPVAVAIDASQIAFQLYKDGVYDDENCKKWILNHAVCAVGYGATDDGQEYYIVRNSWGASWGKEGYVLMARNNNNQCGIANDAIYPIKVAEI